VAVVTSPTRVRLIRPLLSPHTSPPLTRRCGAGAAQTVNKQSLEVAYHHLSNEEASLAIWVADCPTHMLPLFNEVAREVTLMLFESYDQIHHSIFVRITHLPVVDRIRDIRCASAHSHIQPFLPASNSPLSPATTTADLAQTLLALTAALGPCA